MKDSVRRGIVWGLSGAALLGCGRENEDASGAAGGGGVAPATGVGGAPIAGAAGGGANQTGGSLGSGGFGGSGGASGVGGTVGTGGAPTSGGASGVGGDSAFGGAMSSGGVPTFGGASGVGGEPASGGAVGSGGEPAAGGSAGSGVGGSDAVGGAAGESGSSGIGGAAGSPDPGNGWSLVWSDEFDGASIDSSRWEHEVNCWGGGNNEDQCYTDDPKNSFLQDGFLHIVALDDSPTGAIGGPSNDSTIVTLGHSSARLRTLGRGEWTYGRIEVRARLPYGQGLWPAIWMLPTDSIYGGWAASGEIDIMEAVNSGPDNNLVYGTLHYGAAWPNNTNSGTSTTPPSNIWEDFFSYAIEWEAGEIRWFVDDVHYATQTDWYSEGNPFPAPFDQRFHLLLNVAVGGNWPGPPNDQTTFPQEMVVDYVRVYECFLDPTTGHGCGTSDPSITPL